MKNFFTSDKIFATLAAGFSIGFGFSSPDTQGAFAAGLFAGFLASSALFLFFEEKDEIEKRRPTLKKPGYYWPKDERS